MCLRRRSHRALRLTGQFCQISPRETLQCLKVRAPSRVHVLPVPRRQGYRGVGYGPLHLKYGLGVLEVGGEDLAQLDLPERVGGDLLCLPRGFPADAEPGEHRPAIWRRAHAYVDRDRQAVTLDAHPTMCER